MSSAQRLKTLLIRFPNTRALTELNPLGKVWAFQGNDYGVYTEQCTNIRLGFVSVLLLKGRILL